MRVGSLVFSTEQGLGRLAKSFYDAGIVTDPIIVQHSRHPTQTQWYPPSTPVLPVRGSYALSPAVRDMLERVDVFLAFETPFAWDIFRRCRELKKRSYLSVMYECFPKDPPSLPDAFLCPSLLDYEVFIGQELRDGGVPQFNPTRGIYGKDCYFTPVPVQVQWRQREKAEVFVHNAGHGSFHDRNGTRVLLDAWQYVKSPAKLIIRAQESLESLPREGQAALTDSRIELYIGNWPYEDLWSYGDVFIFPERFNGLSLPLQEARASGMLVMAGDRFPMNTWLPTEVEYQDEQESFAPMTRRPLIPTDYYKGGVQIGGAFLEFERAEYDPKVIATKVDEWYGQDIRAYSESGRQWAESMSWKALEGRYRKVLSS